MIYGIHHIGMAVADRGRIRAFQQATLGFTPAPEIAFNGAALMHLTAEFGVSPAAEYLQAPNCYLELLDAAAVPGYRPVNEAGITHICVQSYSIESLYGRAADAGATFHCEPLDLGTGFLYCYARDLEQHVVEFEGVSFAPPDQAPWVAHVALATAQIERLADFYHRILGGTRMGGRKIGPNLRLDQITALDHVELIAVWIAGWNVSLELVQFLNPPTLPAAASPQIRQPGYTHIALETGDLEAALAACLEAGARQVTPIAADHAGRTVFVRDPDGNLIELLALSPERATYSIQHLPQPGVIAHIAAMRPGRDGAG